MVPAEKYATFVLSRPLGRVSQMIHIYIPIHYTTLYYMVARTATEILSIPRNNSFHFGGNDTQSAA
jgi:uncharacterized membrane protein